MKCINWKLIFRSSRGFSLLYADYVAYHSVDLAPRTGRSSRICPSSSGHAPKQLLTCADKVCTFLVENQLAVAFASQLAQVEKEIRKLCL